MKPLSAAAWIARARRWLTEKTDSRMAQRVAGNAFLVRVVSAGLIFVAQVMLARWMGRFEFGIYVYVWTWVVLLGGLAPLGLAYSAQRFIPQYAATGARDLLRGYLRVNGWLCFGLGAATAGIGALTLFAFSGIIPAHYFLPLLIGLAGVPIFALDSAQDSTARAYNWINLALIPVYIGQPVWIMACVAVAYIAGLQLSASTALILVAVGMGLTTLAQLILLRWRLSRTVKRGKRRYEIGTWFKTSLPNFLVDGFFFLLTSIDVLLLQLFVEPDQIAVYYAASKILAIVAFVYFGVSAACAHRFSQYYAARERKRLATFAVDAARWTFWPSLALATILLALGIPFLRLFGPGFESGYPVMIVLAAGLLARASIGPAERLLSMANQQRYCAIIYAAALATSVVLCLILAPFLGVVGAAIGTATAVTLESLLLFLVVKRRLGIRIFAFSRAKPVARSRR